MDLIAAIVLPRKMFDDLGSNSKQLRKIKKMNPSKNRVDASWPIVGKLYFKIIFLYNFGVRRSEIFQKEKRKHNNIV